MAKFKQRMHYVPGVTPNSAVALTEAYAWPAVIGPWLHSIKTWPGAAYSPTLMMEAAEYSETLTYFH